ncbi:MAG TPA: hypothetical protein VHZ75_04560 [Solirubrobacteraceae bacterium]|jgi:hypothetical protein|nr:hypothetical protein [Solirubrobacteraceae bacterium]
MPERDPRDYRGGVHEPPDAKGGADSWADNEGIVPRDMIDNPPPQQGADDQTLGDDVLGEVADRDVKEDSIDHAGGDNADATRLTRK